MSVFLTVIIMIILTGAEIDLFIPSFPELQATFGLTPFMVELTVGLNLLANCIAAFLIGNLGDRYGRRPVILAGLWVFIAGSVFCTFASAYYQLLIGRVLQGIGIAAPAILAYVVIADKFPASEQQKKMGTINGVITLAMAFAPVLGSYINRAFHWQGNFAFLLGLGIVCLILGYMFLPKGTFRPEVSLSLREYKPVLTSKKALVYIGTICALCQPYWIFIAISPILYMQDLGVSLEHFGYYQGAMAGVFSIVSLSSGFWLRRFGAELCFKTGLFLLVSFMAGAIGLIITQCSNPLIITGICVMQAIGIVFPINIIWPLTLDAVPGAKGKLSAAAGSSRLLVTAGAVQVTSYFYNGTFMGVGISMFIGLILALWGIKTLFRLDSLETKLKGPCEGAEMQEASLH